MQGLITVWPGNMYVFLKTVHTLFSLLNAANQTEVPSDISPEQFESILPILEKARKTTKPRIIDLYDVVCAVLYLLNSGYQWRMIPKDFPKWRTVHSYFQQWSEPREDEELSLLEQALKKIRLVKRELNRDDKRKRASLSVHLPG